MQHSELRYPYFQFTVDLTTVRECFDVFNTFERKGIAAAIIYDEDKLLPWSVWKEGIERVGRTSASRISRRKVHKPGTVSFTRPNTTPIYGTIWLDCHEFAEYIDIWGQDLPRGGHPKALNAMERRDARRKYKEFGMKPSELAQMYGCNETTMREYLREKEVRVVGPYDEEDGLLENIA